MIRILSRTTCQRSLSILPKHHHHQRATQIAFRLQSSQTNTNTDHQSTPWLPLASLALATTALATSSSNITQNEAATAADPEAEMRALSKNLQASHERHMVRMAKLLRNLEWIADEAEGEALDEAIDAYEYCLGVPPAVEEKEVVQGDGRVRLTEDELCKLSTNPKLVWEYIDLLKKHGAIYDREEVKRIARVACGIMKREPSLIDLSERCSGGDVKTVTVVGDLHGHFDSLVKILGMLGSAGEGAAEKNHGSPWDGTGVVVFNGDFVDRGENNIEVLLTLLLLKCAYPNHIYLNRGNHEDTVIATVYGCKDEVQKRYANDGLGSIQDIWREIEDVFASLPIAVQTDSAVILHGGLPTSDFNLDQISDITPEERFRIKTMVEPSADDVTCKLVQDIMWSDPQPEDGITANKERGCGVEFGPDVATDFLARHGLKYLIRSHEPMDEGFELLKCDDEGNSVITVFSAESYPAGTGFNSGAIVRLQSGSGEASFDTYHETCEDAQRLTMVEKMASTFRAFADVIAMNRSALEDEFEFLAEKRARRMALKRRFSRSLDQSEVATSAVRPVLITPEQWADAMGYVLQEELPQVNWMAVQQFMAPGDIIDYHKFLNLHCSLSSYSEAKSSGLDETTKATIVSNHEAVFKVFKYLDIDGDGTVDRDEFCRGINEIQEKSPDSSFLFDPEVLFDSIDTDASGSIDLMEFQKAFQAVDVPYHVGIMLLLDEDKSGTIDRHEFHLGIKLLNARLPDADKLPEGIEEVDKLFDELDDDGNGELDTEEFRRFVSEVYPH